MISFVTKHHIEIPSPLLVKTVLLKKIREANIPKKNMSLTSWAPHLGTLKEIEKEFPEMNQIIDNEIEPSVIHLSDNTDSDGKGEELVSRNQKNKIDFI